MLVVGPSWVGDMVMAQSLFRLLNRQRPGIVIDVIAPEWSTALLSRMPEVRNAVILPVGHGQLGIGTRRALGRRLRDEQYARAIVLPRSLKSALVPFFAAIPVRTGFRGEWRYGLLTDVRTLDKRRLSQTVTRFLALGLPENSELPDPPRPRLKVDPENLDRLRARFGLERELIVALMPGAAYGPAKCWPLEYFSELAATLAARDFKLIVLGSAGEREAGETIRRQGGEQVVNLCGETRLEDAVDILSAASAAVSNDSGLMHVAAAAGTHVVALYGSTTPKMTPPLTDASTILYLGLGCSPCFERTCPLGHLRCLREILPATVADAVARVTDRGPDPVSP